MPSPDTNRRAHPRAKVSVPVELFLEDIKAPLRGATSDLSLNGCYIENIFPFPVGTALKLKLQAEVPMMVAGTVVTRDPQVGNGIRFDEMIPEDIEKLRCFLEAIEQPE